MSTSAPPRRRAREQSPQSAPPEAKVDWSRDAALVAELRELASTFLLNEGENRSVARRYELLQTHLDA